MMPNRTMIVLQVVMTCLVVALGAIALVDGRIVVGVLLLALGGCPRRDDRRASSSPRRTRPPVPRHGDDRKPRVSVVRAVPPSARRRLPATSRAKGTRVAATEIEQRGINVIRGLAMDAVQKASNGHPGTAMALAPLAHVLWTRIMQYDASAPDWPDRDRFVLSNGHASIILYTMLYLTGYGVELDDIEALRQWGSRTPGHPEYRHTRRASRSPPGRSGRASPTASASGSPRPTSASGSVPRSTDHHVFVVCGDGCLEEGVSHEAASLAGHLGLGRLVYVYDDNHITIDGPTELVVQRRRPEALRGLRLARRGARRGRQRPRRDRGRDPRREWPRRSARAS